MLVIGLYRNEVMRLFLFSGIYYEKRWEQNIDDFYKEMNIVKLTDHILSK